MARSRRPKDASHYMDVLRKLMHAGISQSPPVNHDTGDIDSLPSLQQRVDTLLGLVNKPSRPSTNMLFFIMYDIESNKVRRNVVKYLLRQGCTRIQKSIFLADLPRDKYDTIRSDLTQVQALYENNDSIIVCPISTDLLRSMKVIGKCIDIDIIMHTRNTLFF